jgi:CTP:molybdopterin cytidylyltransferase MocA
MANFAVILPAAGKSSRFSVQKRKKPFVELKGRPVWVRAAEHFLNRDDVSQVLLVVSREDMDWVKEKFRANLAFMNIEIVEGGVERFESVQKALARVKADVDFVAVHDAARPLLVKEWVDTLFVRPKNRGPQFRPSPRAIRSNVSVRTTPSSRRSPERVSGGPKRRKFFAGNCSRTPSRAADRCRRPMKLSSSRTWGTR